jgi:hypothetical protein
MDNRAQITFEYFAIIAILMVITAVILVYSVVLYANKEGTAIALSSYKDKLLGMLG